jgi:outer membrane protein assembly factor BamB
VRAWLAALASLVLLIPIALLILLIADYGESPQGWLELLVVVVALPYLGALWRLTWHLDVVGGGRAVGAGWFGLLLVAVLLVPFTYPGPWVFWLAAPLFSPRFLANVPVTAHLAALIVYLIALIALQVVLIRQGGLLRRSATEHDARGARYAIVAPFACVALWALSWMVTTGVRDRRERARFLALEQRLAVERAASHAAPPPLERIWVVDLRQHVGRLFERPAAPTVAPDGTIYLAFDTALVAVKPRGEVAWHNPAVRTRESSPVLAPDGTIYVRGTDATLYAVRPDGTLKWAVARAAPGVALGGLPRPAVGKDGTIFGVMPNGTGTRLELIAVSPDGRIRWRTPIGRVLGEIIPAAQGGVYVVRSGALYEAPDTLFAVGVTGVVRWRLPLPLETAAATGLVIGGDDRLLFGRDSGVVPVRAPDGSVARAAPGDRWPAAAVLGDDGAVVTWRGKMIVARGPNGVERWRHDVARLREGEVVRGVTQVRGSGRLLVSTKYRVVVVQADDGRELADYAPTIDRGSRPPLPALNGPTPPVVAPDGTIYVVDDSYQLHALRMR